MKLIINCETGEQTEVPLTKAEAEQLATEQAEIEAQRLASENAETEKTAARQTLLEKLGITENEARLLLS